MEKRRDWWLAVCLIAAVAVCFLMGDRGGGIETEEDRREVFRDTLTTKEPEPIAMIQLRTDTVYLPVVKRVLGSGTDEGGRTSCASLQGGDGGIDDRDSVQVQIPITRQEYSDSAYHLVVSGFRVNVEEISVYPKREVITLKKPPKRWHIGPSAGVGITRKGIEPYMGVSLTYSVYSF